ISSRTQARSNSVTQPGSLLRWSASLVGTRRRRSRPLPSSDRWTTMLRPSRPAAPGMAGNNHSAAEVAAAARTTRISGRVPPPPLARGGGDGRLEVGLDGGVERSGGVRVEDGLDLLQPVRAGVGGFPDRFLQFQQGNLVTQDAAEEFPTHLVGVRSMLQKDPP